MSKTFKKILFIIVTVLMIATMTTVVFAEEADYDGFSYIIVDGEATITGYDGGAETLIIPSEVIEKDKRYIVTEIAENAFEGNTVIESLFVPEGVKKINSSAFAGCKSLKSAVLPESATDLGSGVFYDCSALEIIKISESIERIPEYFLNKCTSLKAFYFSENITAIGECAFAECSALALDETVFEKFTEIENGAFSGCENISGVVLSENLKLLGDRAFSIENLKSVLWQAKDDEQVYFSESAFYHKNGNRITFTVECDIVPEIAKRFATKLVLTQNWSNSETGSYFEKLETVEMTDDVTEIPANAFKYASELTAVKLSEKITSIGNSAFDGCSKLAEINLPDTLTTIGYCIFGGCSSLTEIDLPDGLISIGDFAFSGCSSLTEINFPDTLTTIGHEAFGFCSSLSEIYLGKNITVVENGAFFACGTDNEFSVVIDGGEAIFYGLEKVTVSSNFSSSSGEYYSSPFDYTQIYNFVLAISSDLNLGNNHSIIAEKVSWADGFGPEALTADSLSDFQFIGHIEIPGTVKTIGDGALENCYRALIPESVTSVGKHLFGEGERFVEKLVFLADVDTIYNDTFASEGLQTHDLIIADDIEMIEMSAFIINPGEEPLVHIAEIRDDGKSYSEVIDDQNGILTSGAVHLLNREATCLSAEYYCDECEGRMLLSYKFADPKHNLDASGTCSICGFTEYKEDTEEDTNIEIINDTVEIESFGELAYFAHLFNENGKALKNVNIVLKNDIVWGDYSDLVFDSPNSFTDEWNIIGSEEYPYQGVFDGNGRTIKGASATLINYLGSSGVIKDLTFTDIELYRWNTAGTAIVANNYGTVENCYIESGNVNIDNENFGFIACNNYGTIRNCHSGKIAFESAGHPYSFDGGIASVNMSGGTIENCSSKTDFLYGGQIGGIVSENQAGAVIKNCYYEGNIVLGDQSSAIDYAAGIAAYNYGIISRCYNKGNLSQDRHDSGTTDAFGGITYWNGEEGVIEYCYNEGSVVALYHSPYGCNCVGGISAISFGTVKGCYNIGEVSGTSGFRAGAINGSGDITNCVSLNSVGVDLVGDENSQVYNSDFATEEMFKSGEVTFILNEGVTDGTQAWYQTCGFGIPKHKGKTVYRKNLYCGNDSMTNNSWESNGSSEYWSEHETFETVKKQDPTCVSDGWEEYTRCPRCHYSEDMVIIPAYNEHVPAEKSQHTPTCVYIGWDEFSVCLCGTEIVFSETRADHSIKQYESQKATCTEIGWEAYEECENGCGYTTYEEIPYQHNIVAVEAKAKTCTEIGWEAYEYCTECDYTTYVEIPASHEIEAVEAKANSCTEIGWDAYEYCTECDYSTYTEKPALNHDIITDKAVEATCSQTGLTEGEHCTRCDYMIEQTVIPESGHRDNDGDGHCDYCDFDLGQRCEHCGRPVHTGFIKDIFCLLIQLIRILTELVSII